MSFTTANPIAVGDATEKQDYDVLRDNNDWLRDTMRTQHEVVGAGGRQGRHRALSRYTGSGNVAAGSAETSIAALTSADFATGLWLIIIAAGPTATERINFSEWWLPQALNATTEYSSAAASLLYKIYSSYSTGVPATPYVKFVFDGVDTITLSAKPTGAAALYYTYAVVRWST